MVQKGYITCTSLKWNRNALLLVHNSHCQISDAHTSRRLFIGFLPEGGFPFTHQTPVPCSQTVGLFICAILQQHFDSEIYSKRTKKLGLIIGPWTEISSENTLKCDEIVLHFSTLMDSNLSHIYFEKKRAHLKLPLQSA
ncbi:hypothetical protein SLE2022_192370 [Rubroshorea leprosula]